MNMLSIPSIHNPFVKPQKGPKKRAKIQKPFFDAIIFSLLDLSLKMKNGSIELKFSFS